MRSDFNPVSIEAKWQKRWEEAKVFELDLQKARKPFYSLVMFPYPSGAKLHVGHWFQYSIPDSYVRFQMMRGVDVFHPIGFDAFGLPAENYAIKTGIHPSVSTADNVKTMIEQFKRMGVTYDWRHMVDSSTPQYYRWTQWLFLQMFKNGLAYKKQGNVNFCPSCQTVLANEQAQDGKCERCGSDVQQKALPQWYWKTTQYAQQLLDGLKDLDWPEKTKIMQRNWIGRSEGVNFRFKVSGMQRGMIGPLRWEASFAGSSSDNASSSDSPLTRDISVRSVAGSSSDNVSSSDSPLTGGLNRRLTDVCQSVEIWQKRIHSSRTCHLVFSTHNRSQAFDDQTSAELLLSIIDEVAERHVIAIHEACVMPDHLHVLVSFESTRHLERDVAKKLKGASSRQYWKSQGADGGHLWAEGGHFVDVESVEQFQSVVRYLQENPIKASIPSSGRILSSQPISFEVYDSIPQTFKAQTFVVIAPEHPLIAKLVAGTPQEKEVLAFVEKIRKKKAAKRFDFEEDMEGISTGRVVENPFGMGDLQIWVASFVLMEYGTGVVSCSAHDERDFAFAKKYGIPLRTVMYPSDPVEAEKVKNLEYCYTKDTEGVLQIPEEFKGRHWGEAREDMIEYIVTKGYGKRQINFRLRDWLVSRQRYWGAPIPIVYDPEGNPHPVPEKHLPWVLPTDVEFKPTGKSPLAYSKEFIERTEKIFGKGWTPEFDTMDTFVCSSFYELMFLTDHQREDLSVTPDTVAFLDPMFEKKWMPVSQYIGGPEHACMHLIYARFVMMALKDFGFVQNSEPFKKLVHQGLITHKGAKMSKSKGNVVSPDDFVARYGADVFRMFLMFMGPFTDGGDWSDTGIKGIDRFVRRVHAFISNNVNKKVDQPRVVSALHSTIKKVTDDIENLHFNTSISALMELLNLFEEVGGISPDTAKSFTLILAPLAPHLSEELWEILGQEGLVIQQKWPTFNAALTKASTLTIAIQVNGKLRGDIEVSAKASKEDVLSAAKKHVNVAKFLEGQTVKKEIYVPGKLVSFVV
ncbi:MAG: class I tRNA ligase family protein [Candidatus Peregrinibacteria bacterium]